MEIKKLSSAEEKKVLKQTFKTPSIYIDGLEFDIKDVNVVGINANGKVITDDTGKNPKGFIVFTTTAGAEEMHLSSLLKARTGLDDDGKPTSYRPEGDFIALVQETIGALGANPSLERVRDSLRDATKGTKVRCTWRTFFAIAKDGGTYESHVRDLNIVA